MRKRVSLRPRLEPAPDERGYHAAFHDPASVEAFEGHGIEAYSRGSGVWASASVPPACRPYLRADHSSGGGSLSLFEPRRSARATGRTATASEAPGLSQVVAHYRRHWRAFATQHAASTWLAMLFYGTGAWATCCSCPARPRGETTSGPLRGSIEVQTQAVIGAIRASLAAFGRDPSSIVRCTVWLSDLDLMPRLNAVYAARFGAHLPARSTVEAKLVGGVDVEIAVTAYAGGHGCDPSCRSNRSGIPEDTAASPGSGVATSER